MRRLGGAPVPPARERALGIGIQHGGSSAGLLGSDSERSDEGGLSGAALLAGDHNDVHDLPRYVLTHLPTRWRKRVHTLPAHHYETVKRLGRRRTPMDGPAVDIPPPSCRSTAPPVTCRNVLACGLPARRCGPRERPCRRYGAKPAHRFLDALCEANLLPLLRNRLEGTGETRPRT